MSRLVRTVGIVGIAAGFALAGTPLWAAKQPASGPTRALQRLAEKQGHPAAGAQTLKSFGHQVPKEIEAAAAGVKPDALRKAAEQDGSLASRLETAQGRKLSADQVQRIAAAEREYARQLESVHTKFVRDVAAATGLPEAKIRKPLARDRGASAAEKKTTAALEKLLGHRLTAGQASRVADARTALRSESQSHRSTLARDVGKIAGIPSSIVLELIR
jgi:hypothetical protein